MTIFGAILGSGIHAGTIYLTAYKLNYTLYPVIFIGMLVNLFYRAVAKQVTYLDQSTAGQPSYLLMIQFAIGLIPLYLFFNKFGITGSIVSFVINIIGLAIASYMFHI
jgi:hypothetical protein